MPKKDFTSFDLNASISEMRESISDARVSNIYQLDKKTLLFKLHKPNHPPAQLVLEAGRRLHLTHYSLEKPQMPPAFCMTLRKHLSGTWMEDLQQHEFERIAILSFKSKSGKLKLILELFGEGNIILIDEEWKILQALFFKRMRDRNIIRNEKYIYPPLAGRNPFKVKREDFDSILKTSGKNDVVRTIVRSLGLGGIYAEEILLRANIDKMKPNDELDSSDVYAIFDSLQNLLSAAENGIFQPNIVLDEAERFVDVLPFKLKRYEKNKVLSFDNFNEALDEFYIRVTTAEKALASVDIAQYERESERLKRMVREQKMAIQEEEHMMELHKQIGDFIYANFSGLQPLLEKFSKSWREGKDLTAVVSMVVEAKKSGKYPETIFESFDGRNLAINLRVGELSFSLSLRKNLYENAAEFYERGKRSKEKISGVLSALEDSAKKTLEVEKRLSEVEALKIAAPVEAIEELATRRIETKEWYEKFRWFTSSEGFLVVAGKDVVSNEVLIKKHTEPNDIVFHADIIGAPFAVVKTEGREPGEQTLKEGSEFAGAYSRAWRENMGSVDVYWVKPEQLSKSGPSGEFIPRGAFFVSSKRNWMRGTVLRLGIGVIKNENMQFIGGPVDSVKAKTDTNVVFVPGDFSGKEFLKTILRSLALKLSRESREKMGKPSIECIREFVPYTRGRVVTER